MKFTKEEASKELVSKLTEKGEPLRMSERSINEMLDVLMPSLAGEDGELNDFVEKSFPIFNTASANVRNDVSVSVKSIQEKKDAELAALKEQIASKESNNSESKKEGKEDPNLKKLLEKVEKLEKERAEDIAKATIQSKKTEIKKKLKDEKLDSKVIDKYLAITNVNKDSDVEEIAKILIETYNATKGATGNNTPLGGSKGGKNKDYKKTFSQFKSIVDKI